MIVSVILSMLSRLRTSTDGRSLSAALEWMAGFPPPCLPTLSHWRAPLCVFTVCCGRAHTQYPNGSSLMSKARFVDLVVDAVDAPVPELRVVSPAELREAASILFTEKLDPIGSGMVTAREAISHFRFGFTAAAGVAKPLGLPPSVSGSLAAVAHAYDDGGIPSPRLAHTSHGSRVTQCAASGASRGLPSRGRSSQQAGVRVLATSASAPMMGGCPAVGDAAALPRRPMERSLLSGWHGTDDGEGAAPGESLPSLAASAMGGAVGIGSHSAIGASRREREELLRLLGARLSRARADVRVALSQLDTHADGTAPIRDVARALVHIGRHAEPALHASVSEGAVGALLADLAAPSAPLTNTTSEHADGASTGVGGASGAEPRVRLREVSQALWCGRLPPTSQQLLLSRSASSAVGGGLPSKRLSHTRSASAADLAEAPTSNASSLPPLLGHSKLLDGVGAHMSRGKLLDAQALEAQRQGHLANRTIDEWRTLRVSIGAHPMVDRLRDVLVQNGASATAACVRRVSRPLVAARVTVRGCRGCATT